MICEINENQIISNNAYILIYKLKSDLNKMDYMNIITNINEALLNEKLINFNKEIKSNEICQRNFYANCEPVKTSYGRGYVLSGNINKEKNQNQNQNQNKDQNQEQNQEQNQDQNQDQKDTNTYKNTNTNNNINVLKVKLNFGIGYLNVNSIRKELTLDSNNFFYQVIFINFTFILFLFCFILIL
jgi:hypothetical protein